LSAMQGRALQRDNVNSTPLSDSVTAMIPSLRAGTLLAGFFALTLPLMPVQALLLRLGSRGKRPPLRHFPNWYHRTLCRLLGVRLHVDGALTPGTPTLLLSNHVSWLDIPVLSAMAPVSFVAKREVGTWPLVRTLARLQRTVFVDRERRLTVGVTTSEIEERLSAGDAVVLFAEGTSNDGNRVLPFRSALIGAAGIDQRRKASGGGQREAESLLEVRTLSIAYTHRHGIPLDRFQRHAIAWYGDMELGPHVWTLLKNGPIDVHIRIGEAVSLADFPDRKALAQHAENEVRERVARLLREAGHRSS
jgi:lyso-ornithine lipid O-acyltransferase